MNTKVSLRCYETVLRFFFFLLIILYSYLLLLSVDRLMHIQENNLSYAHSFRLDTYTYIYTYIIVIYYIQSVYIVHIHALHNNKHPHKSVLLLPTRKQVFCRLIINLTHRYLHIYYINNNIVSILRTCRCYG